MWLIYFYSYKKILKILKSRNCLPKLLFSKINLGAIFNHYIISRVISRLRLPGETHLGFRETSKPHLVTFQLMTKRFDIGETSKLCETSKLRRFVLTNQNVPISIVPFVPGVSLVLNHRSRCVPGLESSFPSFPVLNRS